MEKAASILNPQDEVQGKVAARAILQELVTTMDTFKIEDPYRAGQKLESVADIENRWVTRMQNRTQTGPNQTFPNPR